MKRYVVAGLLGLVVADSAGAVPLRMPEPGYLSIDGVYYGYGLREPAPVPPLQAVLSALGDDGFHLRSVFGLGDCQRADGAAPTLKGSGEARLRSGDGDPVEGELGIALATNGPGGVAVASLAACDGATVVFLRSADGQLACSEHIAMPFRRGQCPQLDASDPGNVFFAGFD